MITIGVRELRQRASEYLRAVGEGETIEINVRGRPVALLVPVPEGPPLERLEAQGRLTVPEGDLLEFGDPLEPAEGAPAPSHALDAARDVER